MTLIAQLSYTVSGMTCGHRLLAAMLLRHDGYAGHAHPTAVAV